MIINKMILIFECFFFNDWWYLLFSRQSNFRRFFGYNGLLVFEVCRILLNSWHSLSFLNSSKLKYRFLYFCEISSEIYRLCWSKFLSLFSLVSSELPCLCLAVNCWNNSVNGFCFKCPCSAILWVHSASALWSSTDLHGLRTAVSSLPYSSDI